MLKEGRADAGHLGEVAGVAEGPVLAPIVDDGGGSRRSDAGQGFEQPCLGAVDVDPLRRLKLAGFGDDQSQLVEVGGGGSAAGGGKQVFDGVAAGQRIEAGIGDGAADVDVALNCYFVGEDDFQGPTRAAARQRDGGADEGDGDQDADDDCPETVESAFSNPGPPGVGVRFARMPATRLSERTATLLPTRGR